MAAKEPLKDGDGGSAVLVGRFNVRSGIEERKPVEVAVDVRSLHFFDSETSQGIYDEQAAREREGTR